MKKTYYFALLLSLTIGACDPLEEIPVSALTADSFYQTDKDAVAAVNAAYRPLIEAGYYGTLFITTLDLASDDFYVNPAETNAANHEFGQSSMTSANAHLLSIWTNAYLSIMRANTVLEKVPTIKTTNTTLINRTLGEAKFLRALNLFNLVRLFGDVPVPLTGTNSTEGLDIVRTPTADVYKQIIKDFTDAIAVLPASYSGADLGRPTSWSAKGMLAKVYLTQKNWVESAKLTDEIIKSGKFSLWENYEDVFKPANKNGKESLYEIQFKGPGLGLGNQILRYNLPRNGVLGSGFGVNFATPNLLSAFEASDTRQAATFFSSYTKGGVKYNFTPAHLRKHLDDGAIQGGYTGDTDSNIPVLRLSDVYLMYAEAQNEISGVTPAAIDALNKVRVRAKVKELTPKTQTELREMIWKERRLELIDEGNRWFDLVRTGTLIENIKVAKSAGIPRLATPTEKSYLMPIPQREMEANPKLKQNTGY